MGSLGVSVHLPCPVVDLNKGYNVPFSGHYFRIFEIICFCFVVAICNLVHDVDAILYLP